MPFLALGSALFLEASPSVSRFLLLGIPHEEFLLESLSYSLPSLQASAMVLQ